MESPLSFGVWNPLHIVERPARKHTDKHTQTQNNNQIPSIIKRQFYSLIELLLIQFIIIIN